MFAITFVSQGEMSGTILLQHMASIKYRTWQKNNSALTSLRQKNNSALSSLRQKNNSALS